MIDSILDVAYCILTYMSSSHYIKQRNMILSNEIQENEWKIMMHSGMRPRKKRKGTLTFHRTIVLPLLATTSGAGQLLVLIQIAAAQPISLQLSNPISPRFKTSPN